jgi:hypothetical protein
MILGCQVPLVARLKYRACCAGGNYRYLDPAIEDKALVNQKKQSQFDITLPGSHCPDDHGGISVMVRK